MAERVVELWTEVETGQLRWYVEEGRPVAEIAHRLGRSEGDVRATIQAWQLWPAPGRWPVGASARAG